MSGISEETEIEKNMRQIEFTAIFLFEPYTPLTFGDVLDLSALWLWFVTSLITVMGKTSVASEAKSSITLSAEKSLQVFVRALQAKRQNGFWWKFIWTFVFSELRSATFLKQFGRVNFMLLSF